MNAPPVSEIESLLTMVKVSVLTPLVSICVGENACEMMGVPTTLSVAVFEAGPVTVAERLLFAPLVVLFCAPAAVPSTTKVTVQLELAATVMPLGSPIDPVAPPARAIGRCPASWKRRSPISGTRLPTCRLSAVGSNPA